MGRARIIFTHISMVPVHVLEGVSVRFHLARFLYRTISSVYSLGRPLFYYGEDHFEASVKPGERVLDLGSGTGYLSRILAGRAGKVIGLELEKEMVRKAVRKNRGVSYVIGDMTRLPFRSGSFDRAASLGALHCVDPVPLFAEAGRVLRPGGEVQVLSEVKILPRFVPAVSAGKIRSALKQAGMAAGEEIRIGSGYTIFRATKIPGK